MRERERVVRRLTKEFCRQEAGGVEEFPSNFVHNGSYLLRGESVMEAHVTLSGVLSSSGEVCRYFRSGLGGI